MSSEAAKKLAADIQFFGDHRAVDLIQRALDAAAAEAIERAAQLAETPTGQYQVGHNRLPYFDGDKIASAIRALAASKPDCIPECKENRRKYAESVQFRLDVARGKALLLEQAEQPLQHHDLRCGPGECFCTPTPLAEQPDHKPVVIGTFGEDLTKLYACSCGWRAELADYDAWSAHRRAEEKR